MLFSAFPQKLLCGVVTGGIKSLVSDSDFMTAYDCFLIVYSYYYNNKQFAN